MRLGPLLCFAFFLAASSAGNAQTPLTKKSFSRMSDGDGIAIFHVRWQRFWNCGGFENVQLQRLAFRLLEDDVLVGQEWVLQPASRLSGEPRMATYVHIVKPGTYALSGVTLKAAASLSDIRVSSKGSEELVPDGEAVGGSFSVDPGEIVYVGHFGVDCSGAPTLWRTHLENRAEFSGYVAGFRKAFPFVGEREVRYRLFKTTLFGYDHELGE